MTKPPRFRADGQPDGRGRSDASRATRFIAGDRRKRGSRPKGSRDERTLISAIRDMTVVATAPNGKKTKMNTPEAIIQKQRQKALQGDLKAAEFVMKRLDRYEPPSFQPDHTAQLLEEDVIILAAARRRGVLPEIDDDAEDDAT